MTPPNPQHRSGHAQTVIRLISWWWNMGWVAASEVIIGFIAAWGKGMGFGFSALALGVATVYLFPMLTAMATYRYARTGAMIAGATCLSLAVAGVTGNDRTMFWCISAVAGILSGFRDQTSIAAMAWMPVRAMRNGGSSLHALLASTVLSGCVVALALFAAGMATDYWTPFPAA